MPLKQTSRGLVWSDLCFTSKYQHLLGNSSKKLKSKRIINYMVYTQQQNVKAWTSFIYVYLIPGSNRRNSTKLILLLTFLTKG
uniref:Uncharacterized protein n=1 Tax=Pyxicephalus adspersus TaxID=30357 RepID=A0AAV3ATQ4_PYXAD|nr:TPA: hypothetical protein GDO54_008310 [Pyxicephalus adspersus]